MTSFFTVKSISDDEVNVCNKNPVTPPNADHLARYNRAKFSSPLTPSEDDSGVGL